MNMLRTFFKTLARTFTDPKYYQDIIAAAASFSFKYFFFFYLLLAVAITTYTSVNFLPTIGEYADQAIDDVVNLYPDDLVLTLDGGQLATEGVAEPIIFGLPSEADIGLPEEEIENLLVIDTSADVGDINNYKAFILLTKTDAVMRSDESLSAYRVIPLSEISSQMPDKILKLDKPFIDQQMPQINQALDQLMKMLPWLVFLFLAAWLPISRLFYLLLMSLVTWALASMFGRGLNYGKVFQIGLHTVTIADGVTKLQRLIYPSLFPFLFTLAFLGTTVIALFALKPIKKTS